MAGERRALPGHGAMVTPAMMAEGRRAFDEWLDRWDYLEAGIPDQDSVDEMLVAVFFAMGGPIAPTDSR